MERQAARPGAISAWSDSGRHHRWPDTEPLFDSTLRRRSAVVLVTDDVLELRGDHRVEVLLGLLADDERFRVLRLSHDGPPASAEHVGEGKYAAAVGWVTLDIGDDGDGCVITCDGDGITRSGVHSKGQLLLSDSEWGDAIYGPYEPDRTERRKDVIAEAIASAVGADIVVTTRSHLLSPELRSSSSAAMLAPEVALGPVGLHLRMQREFIVRRDADGRYTNRCNMGLFYWIAARDSLPAGWFWMAACIEADAGTANEQLSWLASSLHERVVRALQARDRAYAAVWAPIGHDTGETAVAEFDSVCYSLMGAFDAAARVMHLVGGLKASKIYRAGWQHESWRKKWRSIAPQLFGATQSGSRIQHTVTVVRLLRNTIHGEALRAISLTNERLRAESTLVELPRGDRNELVAAMRSLGADDEWGIEELVAGHTHAHVAKLVDQVVRVTLPALDEMLATMPVQLLGVDASQLPTGAPTDGRGWSKDDRAWIRTQLQLD